MPKLTIKNSDLLSLLVILKTTDSSITPMLTKLIAQAEGLHKKYLEDPARLFEGHLTNRCIGHAEREGDRFFRCVIDGEISILQNIGAFQTDMLRKGYVIDDVSVDLAYYKGAIYKIGDNNYISKLKESQESEYIGACACGETCSLDLYRPFSNTFKCTLC